MTDEELRELFDKARQENAAAHEETRAVLRQENAAAHEETRRLFDVTAEGLRHDIRLLADGLVDGRSEGRSRAMIKFSYAELDRRISSLEERVDRLESGKPH